MQRPVVIFVTMLAVLAGMKAHAQTYPKPVATMPIKPPVQHMILPPVEYDHEYTGDLTIKMVDTLEELRVLCKQNTPYMLACSWSNDRSCLVIMIRDEVMRRSGWTTGLLLRHERGHCNGWSADHKGERPLTLGTHWVPANARVRVP